MAYWDGSQWVDNGGAGSMSALSQLMAGLGQKRGQPGGLPTGSVVQPSPQLTALGQLQPPRPSAIPGAPPNPMMGMVTQPPPNLLDPRQAMALPQGPPGNLGMTAGGAAGAAGGGQSSWLPMIMKLLGMAGGV